MNWHGLKYNGLINYGGECTELKKNRMVNDGHILQIYANKRQHEVENNCFSGPC